VLALDSDATGSSGGRIHVGRQQQGKGIAGGSGRLACLSLALPIATWK
jgi:hypothetical protein